MTNRAKPFQFPDGYGPEVFLESCWQNKPLLCRNALEDAGQSLTDEEILEVAIQDTSDARLISIEDGAHAVEQGPFAVDRFDVLPTSPWSLLIQSMEVCRTPPLGLGWAGASFGGRCRSASGFQV